MVAGLLLCSEVGFEVFRYGDTAAAGDVEENDCVHEGLRLDKERIAPEDGLKGIIFEAIVLERAEWPREREWCALGKKIIGIVSQNPGRHRK